MRRISSWPIRNIRAGARLTPKGRSRKNPRSRRTPTRPIRRPANRSKAKAVRASAFSAAGATPDAESFLPADAFIYDLDDAGRMKTYGKVALVAVVGNEDGAHHVSAEMFQALNDS